MTARPPTYIDRLPCKPSCVDAELGHQLSLALGRPLDATLAEHLIECAACQLERARYEQAAQQLREIQPQELWTRLRRSLRTGQPDRQLYCYLTHST